MNIQDQLTDWAKIVVDKYDNEAKQANISYYTQSNLKCINDHPKVLILGINPGSTGEYAHLTPKEFMLGNKCFSKDVSWHFWNRLKKIFNEGGIGNLLEDDKLFVFSNIFHFGTLKAKDLLNNIKSNPEFVDLAKELIGILKPEIVVCLGKEDCMSKLFNNSKEIELIKGELSYGTINNIPVYGIPHTSKYYTNEEFTMLGKVVGALYRKEIAPDQKTIASVFCKEISDFEKRKEQIKPENILKVMIEDAFKRYVRKEQWEKDSQWYKISSHFVARVTSSQTGYVTIRDNQFEANCNYSKRTINNQEAILRYLESKGYELNDSNRSTSLGHKLFSRYEGWKKGPQYVVLEILKEIDELGLELETIYGNRTVEL